MKKTIRVVAIVLLLSLGLFLLPEVFFRYNRSWAQIHDFQEAEKTGHPLKNALIEYRERHGHCPRDISETGLTLPWTRFGHWHYSVEKDGLECEIYLGGPALTFNGLEVGWRLTKNSDWKNAEWDYAD